MPRWEPQGRHRTIPNGSTRGQPYRTDWGAVVGERIRRLRLARGLTLRDVRERIYKPNGGSYSLGYLSKLERGWSNAPLYVYLTIGELMATVPGQLLGPDDTLRGATAGEMTIVAVARHLGLRPHEAVLRLLAPGAGLASADDEDVLAWAAATAANPQPDLNGMPLRARPIQEELAALQRSRENFGRH
jgi:transcriptional regulator with XRE-family HTH domain